MRRTSFTSYRNQQGYLAFIAVILIVFIGFLGTAATFMAYSGASSTVNFTQANKAFYIAEAGLEEATRFLATHTLSGAATRIGCASVTGNASLTNTSFGTGAFTVTTINSSPIYATTTLSAAIVAADTTIPLTSVAGFATTGRVVIDYEAMNYGGISGSSLVGVERGADGTTAVTHVIAAPVAEYQCTLDSKGGIPNVTAPNNLRELQQTVQLQDAWAVGTVSGANNVLLRWNKPTEIAWNNASAALGGFNLSSVNMISYADGWAVGASATFLHWNGTSWTTVASGLPGATYNSVFCLASNDCHVAGGNRNFGHWNGSTWTRLFASGSVAATNLLSVHCDSSSDCWAVGSNAGGGKFYQGSGSPVAWVGIAEAALSAFPYNGVFCNSATDCWAVGLTNVLARKNGAAWANFTAAAIPSVRYNSVYCNSTSDCWAVGNISGGSDVFVHWNGTSWSRDPSNPAPVGNLSSVNCVNSNDCWAVGAATGFVHWDGVSWTQSATSGLPSSTVASVSTIKMNSQPQSTWAENFG